MHTNYPKLLWLKTNICYLTVSVGQATWYSLAGSLGSWSLTRLKSCQDLTEKRCTSLATTDLVSISIVFPIPESHIHGNVKYTAF